MANRFKAEVDIEIGKDSASPAINKIVSKKRPIDLEMRLPLSKLSTDFTKFEQSIDAATARVVAFTATTSLIYGVGNAFQRLVSDAIKIESVMTRIQSVFGSTAAETKKFQEEIFKLANQTGVSFYQAAEAAEEFSRQGLNLNKTLDATRAALVISKLSGTTAKNAIEGLTATLSTFADEALDYVQVADKLLALDAAFATSAGGLTEGLKRVAGVAAEAGLSLDQTAASLAALKQVTGRSEAVLGNSLKSIFTTIQTEKIQKELSALGVETKNSSGEFRNLIDVLSDLSKVYRDLDDAQRALIAQKIGKTYQANAFQGILKTFETGDYEKALDVSQGASGDAARRIEMLNKTTESALQRFSNNITKLGGELGDKLGKPILEKVVGYFNNIVTQATEIFEGKNPIGNAIINGIVSAISGPGVLLVAVGLGKLLVRITKETGQALQAVAGLSSRKENIKKIDEYIATRILPKINDEELERIKNLSTVEAKQKAILELMSRQIAIQQRSNLQVSQEGSQLGLPLLNAYDAGRYAKKIPNKAKGFLPEELNSIVAEKKDIMKGVGGARPTAHPILKTVNIGNGPEKVVVNSDEKVVRNFAGTGQDAIINREMMGYAKGKLTKKQREALERKTERETDEFLYSIGNQNAINLGRAKKNKSAPGKSGSFQTIVGALSDQNYVALRDLGRALKNSEKVIPKYNFPSSNPLLSKAPSSLQKAVNKDLVDKLTKDLEKSFRGKPFQQKISGLEAESLALKAGGSYAGTGKAGAAQAAILKNNADRILKIKEQQSAFRENLNLLKYKNLPRKEFESSAPSRSTVTLGTVGSGSALTSIRSGKGLGRFFGQGSFNFFNGKEDSLQRSFSSIPQSPFTATKSVSAFPRLVTRTIPPSSESSSSLFSNYNPNNISRNFQTARGVQFDKNNQIFFNKSTGLATNPSFQSGLNTTDSGGSVRYAPKRYDRNNYFSNSSYATLSSPDLERVATNKGLALNSFSTKESALIPRRRRKEGVIAPVTYPDGPITSYSESISQASADYLKRDEDRLKRIEEKLKNKKSLTSGDIKFLDREDPGGLGGSRKKRDLLSADAKDRLESTQNSKLKSLLSNPLAIAAGVSFGAGAISSLSRDKDGNETTQSKAIQAIGDVAGVTSVLSAFGKLPGVLGLVGSSIVALNKIFDDSDIQLQKVTTKHEKLVEKYRKEGEAIDKFSTSFATLRNSLSTEKEKSLAKKGLEESLAQASDSTRKKLLEARSEKDLELIQSDLARDQQKKEAESAQKVLFAQFRKDTSKGVVDKGFDFFKGSVGAETRGRATEEQLDSLATTIVSSFNIDKLPEDIRKKLESGDFKISTESLVRLGGSEQSLSYFKEFGTIFDNQKQLGFEVVDKIKNLFEARNAANLVAGYSSQAVSIGGLADLANAKNASRLSGEQRRKSFAIEKASNDLSFSQPNVSEIAYANAEYLLSNSERANAYNEKIQGGIGSISTQAKSILEDRTLTAEQGNKFIKALNDLSQSSDLDKFAKDFKSISKDGFKELEPLLVEQIQQFKNFSEELENGNSLAKQNFDNLIRNIQKSQRSNLFGLGNISGARDAIKTAARGTAAAIAPRERSKYEKRGYFGATSKDILKEEERVRDANFASALKIQEGILAERDNGFLGVELGQDAPQSARDLRERFLSQKRNDYATASGDIMTKFARENAATQSDVYIKQIDEDFKKRTGRKAFEGGDKDKLKDLIRGGKYDEAIQMVEKFKKGSGYNPFSKQYETVDRLGGFLTNTKESESLIPLAAKEKALQDLPSQSIDKQMLDTLQKIASESSVQTATFKNIEMLLGNKETSLKTSVVSDQIGNALNEQAVIKDRLNQKNSQEEYEKLIKRRKELNQQAGEAFNSQDFPAWMRTAIKEAVEVFKPEPKTTASVDQNVNLNMSISVAGSDIFKDPAVQAEMASLLKPYINQKITESIVQNGGKKPIELVA